MIDKRESGLTPSVSLSLVQNLEKLAEPCTLNLPRTAPRGSHSRLAASHQLSNSAMIRDKSESEHLADIGAAMLNIGDSIDSGLNLRSTTLNRLMIPGDVPPVPVGTGRVDGEQERTANVTL